MQPIVYTSKDVGAPQITQTAGAMNAVIKSCLVTGYGTKGAAGWEVLKEDLAAHTLALRSTNLQSIKSVFVVGNSSAQTGVQITGYLDWDDVTQKPTEQYGLKYGITHQVSSPDWVIVADDYFCWIWCAANNPGTYGIVQAFGDLISITQDGGISGIIGYKTSTFSELNTNINDLITSRGTAYLASQPFKTDTLSALGGDSREYLSNIYVLSKQVAHIANSAGKKEPAFFIPGLLVSAAEIPNKLAVDGSIRLDVGGGLVNPIVLLRMVWQGFVPISADNWG